MDIEAAEIALIERIKTVTGARVEAFPEDPSLYVTLQPELVHLVRFEGVAFNDPTPNNAARIVQDVRIEFVVVSAYRHLKAHGGIYAHLEALRQALTGYTLPDIVQASALWPVRQSILKEEKGLWWYQSIFAMTAMEQAA